jgi:hypothetical protein
MKLLALLSLALLATALIVDAKTEKDVTSLQIGVKVGVLSCPCAVVVNRQCSTAKPNMPPTLQLQLCEHRER